METALEKWSVKYAKKLNCLAFKMNNKADSGWPDRHFLAEKSYPLCGGQNFYIEFKRLGEKCSRLQSERIVRLIDQGQIVYVVDNREDAKNVIDRHCRGVGTPRLPRASREAHDSARRGGPLVGSRIGEDFL